MALQTYIPWTLRDHVHMFWAWEGYAPTHAKERILPHGSMEITINLNAVPFRLEQDTPRRMLIHGAMVAGARTRPFVIDTATPLSLLSVWFKPGGAQQFFGVSGAELHNHHVPLETLWGTPAHDLYEQLQQTPSPPKRFWLLEQYLCQRLQTQKRTPALSPHLSHALELLNASPTSPLHNTPIHAIAEAVSLSHKRFIACFRDEVGMTPKQYQRVRRFQTALAHITHHTTSLTYNTTAESATATTSSPWSWAELALACGYYDQAHFINEFKRLAGITPAAYLPQDPQHRSNLAIL